MRIIIFFLFLTSFSSFAVQFKPIGSPPKYFQPAGSVDSMAARMRGAITVNGKFAFATLNPRNAIGLGRQLARSSPYALLGLAALDFFQDENDDWFSPPEKTGERITKPPETVDQYTCSGINGTSTVLGSVSDCASWALPAWKSSRPQEGQGSVRNVEIVIVDNNYSLIYDYCEFTNVSTGGCYLFGTGYTSPLGSAFPLPPSPQCPNSQYPNYSLGIDSDNDSIVDFCSTPQDELDYNSQPTDTLAMSQALGDEMFRTNQELTSWEPFKDYPSDSFLSPDYVESYNQPDVTPTFDEYLKNVASGNYQTFDATAPNYVPAEMLQPTQAAIKGMEKGDPIVDPTTGSVVNPDIKTDGAASKPVDPNAQAVNVNVTFPEDDTISQTEYEQSNDAYFQQFNEAGQLESLKIDTAITDLETAETDFITSLTDDVTNFEVPEFPTFKSLFPDLPFGSCVGFSLNTSIAGVQRMMTFDKHCPPYNLYIHPLLVWFLYSMTGLYVFYLAGETLKGK